MKYEMKNIDLGCRRNRIIPDVGTVGDGPNPGHAAFIRPSAYLKGPYIRKFLHKL